MPTMRKEPKRRPKKPIMLGPNSNGTMMTPQEFDNADADDVHLYELINRVVVVSPLTARPERDANEQLMCSLRNYQESHQHGNAMDCTLPGYVVAGDNRRWADRVVWTGLGRLPTRFDVPSIVVDFVSKRMLHREQDYETKRDVYQGTQVQEYWIIDRFDQSIVVLTKVDGKFKRKVIRANQTYRTPLLPGFELPLARLFEVANRWKDEDA